MIQPIECGSNVVHLAFSVIMFPMAQAGTAKIEAQHRKTETVQRLHGVKDHLVMESSAKPRMRMAHHGGVGGFGFARVEQRLQTAGRPIESEGTDYAGWGIHRVVSNQNSISMTT